MLNTCLTVKAGSPGSHSNRGWEKFTDKVIAVIDKWGGANLPTADTNSTTRVGVGRGIVFMAWGSWAQKRVAGLNRVSRGHDSLTITPGSVPLFNGPWPGLWCLRSFTSFNGISVHYRPFNGFGSPTLTFSLRPLAQASGFDERGKLSLVSLTRRVVVPAKIDG